jgi:hypothetical protein
VKAQSVPVGTPIVEEFLRRQQIEDTTGRSGSFTVRPISLSVMERDSLYRQLFCRPFKSRSFGGNGIISILPLIIRNQINSDHPFGWNDGSMIPSKGYETQVSAGFFVRAGILSLQLNPEFVFAQNASFSTQPLGWSDSIWRSYYNSVINKIEQPERFGNRPYARLFPGQSTIRVNWKKLSLGLSTENLWWGPGIRNALIMTNNAPGFAHITFNTTSPLSSPVGSFEWQLISGLLQSSGILPDTTKTFNGSALYSPKPNGDRYLNGFVICLQPKWTKGFYLGFSRLFYLYRSDVKVSFNGYLPVLGTLFKSASSDEDRLKRDQILSLFFRLLLPKEQAEVYAEYGRNDHAGSTRDFLMEPEHSRALIVGFKKIFPLRAKAKLEMMMEFTNLQIPSTSLVREQESWYAHYQVRDGYTNLGQVVGAGIGPGGNSQTFNFNWLRGTRKIGFQFERITHNNDFYYAAFAPTRNYQAHWIDLSFGGHANWVRKSFFCQAELAVVKSLNYYWQQDTDIHNLHLNFSVGYLF